MNKNFCGQLSFNILKPPQQKLGLSLSHVHVLRTRRELGGTSLLREGGKREGEREGVEKNKPEMGKMGSEGLMGEGGGGNTREGGHFLSGGEIEEEWKGDD